MNWVIENIWRNEYLVNWLSAVGTVGAVWVSLWLAKKDDIRRVKLEVTGINEPTAVINKTGSTATEVISFSGFNYSKFPIQISSMGFFIYDKPYNKILDKSFLLKKFFNNKANNYFLQEDETLRILGRLPLIIDVSQNKSIYVRKSYFLESLKDTNKKFNDDSVLYLKLYFKDNFGKFYYDYHEVKYGDIGKKAPSKKS